MADDAEAVAWRALRATFDLDADAYDRTRPVLPDALFDDFVRVARLSSGDRVVEIGCGTGQATVPLAQRELAVTAIELGPDLAARARANVREFPGVNVVTSSFEDWVPSSEPFRAVIAVSSLHWIDPAVRFAKPASLLAPGDAMVVARCEWARPADADEFFFAVDEDYEAVGYAGEPPAEPDAIGAWHFPPEALEHFEEVFADRYPFEIRFGVEDYLANLATQSSTHALGAARGHDFLSLVRARLDAMDMTEVTRTLAGRLTVGRRRH